MLQNYRPFQIHFILIQGVSKILMFMLLQICVFWFIWRINVDRLFYKLIFFYFIYLVLVVLGLCYCTGFSLIEASEGSSLAALCRLLIVVASLVAHRL